jgi:hypothetical protein
MEDFVIKTLTLLGVALVLLGGTGLGAGAEISEAKPALLSQAAVAIYPGLGCSYYPQIITQPGGYNLAGNITLPAGCGADAIDVKADNVVIDLNGNTITGTGAGTGIGINGATHSNVTVKNGSIVKMGGGGVVLGEGASVVDLTASSNGTKNGINENGIFIEDGSVRHVHANSNSLAGILANEGTEVSDSVANNNVYGILLNSGGTVLHNVVIANGYVGIAALSYDSVVSGNTIEANGFDSTLGVGAGIWGAGQISNNTVVENAEGIAVLSDPTSIVGNTIGKNSSFGITDGTPFLSYGNNQFFGNNETTPPHPGNQVQGGVQMGPNICDGVPCP